MGAHRATPVIVTTVGVLLATGPTALATADSDVPPREPSLAWEAEVDCDSAAELAQAPAAPRRCSLGFDDLTVYVHQYTRPGRDGTFQLSAFDLATGERRWSADTIPSSDLVVLDHAIVVVDKSGVEVFDPATGSRRFAAGGSFAEANRYGVLLMDDGNSVTALDSVTGTTLWQEPGSLGGACRDFVVLVRPTVSSPDREPFRVVEHRTGELRWRSDERFDPRSDHLLCSRWPVVHTTNGERLHEWDAYDGWLNWSAPVDGAGPIEMSHDVVLVRTGESVVAVDHETGAILWDRPAASVGDPVSVAGRLRANDSGVFLMHAATGEVVTRASPTRERAARFRVVGVSETRVVVASGSVVTTYGLNDLGTSWQLDVGGAPDDLGVSNGVLVVRSGTVLRGYS